MPLTQQLAAIYDEMRARQLRAIREAGAFRSDPYFVPDARRRRGSFSNGHERAVAKSGTSNGKEDERRCFAISAVIDGGVDAAWTVKYRALEERLREEFGDYGVLFSQTPGVLVPTPAAEGDIDTDTDTHADTHAANTSGGQLHWTLMQLAGFKDYDEAAAAGSTFTSDNYLDCIRDSLTVGGLDTSLEVAYVGVVAVATGLLMVGLPSADVNVARDAIRHRLSRRDLPLQEPFVNDIVHSTIFRVTGDPADHPPDLHDKLLALAKEFEDAVLGTVKLDRFQVGAASWRMLREEVNATPPLRVWTLSSKTPKEHYDSALCQKGGANHYTVSGASGTNLAMELKQNLSRGVLAGSRAEIAAASASPSFAANEGTVTTLPLIRPAEEKEPPSNNDADGYAVGEEYDSPVKEPTAAGSHFTVSGASGAKLAMELRQNLSRGRLAGSKPDLAAAGSKPDLAAAGSAGEDEVLPELRKQIEEERKALERLYNLDFY